MSAIRLLQILALAAGAAAFAPYAGPDLESFEFVYQVPDGPALRIAGTKPRGRDAPAVVFLPYGIIPYEDQLPFFLPAMEAVAQRGFAVALVEYPDIEVYPDQGSGAGYYVVPAGESPSLFGPPETATPHNSFSNPIDGFFAPGGTEVWQADKTFEWLLATAFGPERSSSPP